MRRKIKKVLMANPRYWLSIIILIILIIFSLAAPFLPFDPTKTDVSSMLQDPSGQHFFGTDEVGRDYFIRVLYGGRVSLLVGFLAMIVTTAIGTVVGLVSGFFGGAIDWFLMRVVDILSSIPWLVLAIVLSVFLKPGMMTIIIIIGGFSWMGIARLIRAETLSIKERDFVLYAKFINMSPFKIIATHIVPGVLPTIIVASTSSIASAIMTESTLSFLGLGIQQPMSSWGSLLQNAQSNLQSAPHMAIIPGVFIMLTIYAFNQIGNILRDMYSLGE